MGVLSKFLTPKAGIAVAVIALIMKLLTKKKKKKRGKPQNKDKKSEGRKLPKSSIGELLKVVMPSLFQGTGKHVLALSVLCVANTLLSDRIARLQGNIFQALYTQDVPGFLRQLALSVGQQFGMSLVSSSLDHLVKTIGLNWREALYNDLHRSYFKGLVYYKLTFVDKRIVSPEEILTSDVEQFADGLSHIVHDLLKAVLDGSFFTFRLARETSIGWSLVTWAYVTSAVFVVRSISPNFGKLHAIRSELSEAFRSSLSRLTTHSEAIAALSGEFHEANIIESRFRKLVTHMRSMVKTQWLFGMAEDFITKYCASTVAMIVILGPFFGGNLRSDRSPEGDAITLGNMRYVTSVIINQLTAIAGLARSLRKVMQLQGVTKRVGGMRKILKELAASEQASASSTIITGDVIAFEEVEINTPNGHRLVSDLSFHVQPGSNLLISGPNVPGAGKSSIFRCLGALWNIKKGTITKPGGASKGLHETVYYLPQKPYNVIGDLREQITYPETAADGKASLSDSELAELLKLVDLEYLMTMKSDSGVNWEDSLSLGETQRLAMARLFYHTPKYAILDECTSGVSHRMERRLYALCAERNITCITISHRPALIAFHDLKLELDGRGSYTLETLTHADGTTSAQLLSSVGEINTAGDTDVDDEGNSLDVVAKSSPVSSTFAALLDPREGVSKLPKLKRIRKLLRLLVPSFSDEAVKYLLGLVAVVGGRVALSDRIARLNGETVRLLLLDDLPGFKRLVGISLVQCVASSVLAPLLLYFTRRLSLLWRGRLHRHMMDLFLKKKSFYKLMNVHRIANNADQRLTEDLEKLCLELSNTFPDIVKPIADILWFSTYSVFLIGAKRTALLYLYAVGGLGFLRAVAPNFEQLVQKRAGLDGTFRKIQLRLRTHAESVAFFGGNDRESEIAQRAFGDVMRHARGTLSKESLYAVADNWVVRQMPTIVTWSLSLLYARDVSATAAYRFNRAEGGALGFDLRYVASAVSHVFLALGEILQLYKRMQKLSGYTLRITELEDMLQALADEDSSTKQLQLLDSEDIRFEDASIVTPDGRVLLNKLNLTVSPGCPILVTGPNSTGKTSLFRTLSGLWPVRDGQLFKPLASSGDGIKIFFVPQRPYCAPGRLADQITYPLPANLNNAEQMQRLEQLLASVSLAYLVERQGGWAAEDQWEDVLSLGEQQRLGMARLFYHRPKYAVLDQCTDAVSVDVEEQLYQLAEEQGITIITISQRSALTSHHKMELQLSGGGEWQLSQVTHQASEDEEME